MRYLLVVGFYCKVYRHEPLARIFVNNKLLDEFKIQDCEDIFSIISIKKEKILKNQHKLQLQPFSEPNKWWYSRQFNNLRFYEIEPNKQDKLQFCIDIYNDDNNYTNGFLSSSTLLQLKNFYFIPLHKKLVDRLYKNMKKKILTENYAWYRMGTNYIFNLLNTTQWQAKNTKIIDNKFDKWIGDRNIGGSGSFTCELEKKYGIFIKCKKFYRYQLDKSSIDYMLDKYKQHEN